MRVVADAHALPFRDGSVDVVIGNPPYPGNGCWDGSYWAGVKASMAECLRVLRPGGTGWFLLGKRQVRERWLAFDHTTIRWAHDGSSDFPTGPLRPGRYWGVIAEPDLVPLILQYSDPGGTVLDPFAGRGNIPRLAARLGRIPLGSDIDPDQLDNGGPYG